MSLPDTLFNNLPLKEADPEIYRALQAEEKRQQENLILIASENLASCAVQAATGSVLTNKYAEGYPGARYYGGCLWADEAEELAIKRAAKLFDAEHVNVQPHAGALANMAAYLAFLKPGERILGMDLNHGGHLTHGSPVNVSGRCFKAYSYGVDRATGYIEPDEVRKIAKKIQPKLLIAGASAYPREVDFAVFRSIADEVGAFLLADIAHTSGFIAAKLHDNPVKIADVVTTTTHKTLKGPRGGMIMCRQKFAAAIDRAVFPGLQGGPLMHVIAAKAVAFKEAQTKNFASYQEAVLLNAKALAEGLKERGLNLVTGGTDTHLVLVDLRHQNITGSAAEKLLESVHLTVNKNTIPFDPGSAHEPSGIRLGTPLLTARGLGPEQMHEVASLISQALENSGDSTVLARIKKSVLSICQKFPVFSCPQEEMK